MRPSWRAGLGLAAAGGLCLFTISALFRGAGARPRTAVLALREDEARALAARSGCALDNFWELARVAGVRAVALSPRRLEALWARGEALRFAGAEGRRWPWAVSLAGIPPGNAVWTRDRALLARLQASAASRKLAVSTFSASGVFVLRLPEGFDARELSAGYDPEAVERAGNSKLDLALEPDESASWASPPAFPGRVVYMEDPASEHFSAALRSVRERGAWIAWPDSSRSSGAGPAEESGGRALLSEVLPHEEIPGELWRAVWGRGARLLIVPVFAEDGVERTLGRLRRIAGRLRGADFSLELPVPAGPPPHWGPWERSRCLLAFLLAGFLPMLAVRQGLAALRCVSCKTRWPQAYPAPELALGMLRTAATAAGGGLACYALTAFPGWDLGAWRTAWDAWVLGLPIVLSAAALYAEDAKDWRRLPGRSVTVRSLLGAGALIFLLVLPVHPQLGPAAWLPEGLWWLPLRWREVLVGYPCLLTAFSIHLRRMESRQPRAASVQGGAGPGGAAGSEPRPWLLLGLLAPIGTVRAFGLGLMTPEMLVSHTVQGLCIGAALGGLWLARAALRLPTAAALALAASLAGQPAAARDLKDPRKRDMFVAVELDLSGRPGDLRDAVAGLSKASGFAEDARFPAVLRGDGGDRAQVWGWLSNEDLSSAFRAPRVERVEVSRDPGGRSSAAVPPPREGTGDSPGPEPAAEASPFLRFAIEHHPFLLLLAILLAASRVILRPPRKPPGGAVRVRRPWTEVRREY